MVAPRDLFDIAFLRDACLSPDGLRVCYLLSRVTDRESTELWILDLGSGEMKQAPILGSVAAPSWSPDGAAIAMTVDGRVRIATYPDFLLSPPCLPEGVVIERLGSWAPDSRRIAFVARFEDDTGPSLAIRSRQYSAEGVGLASEFRRHLIVLDTLEMSHEIVSRAGCNVMFAAWHPSSEEILILAGKAGDPASTYDRAVRIVSPTGDAARDLLAAPFYIEAVAWLSGGRVAAAGARSSTDTIPTNRLYLLEASGRMVAEFAMDGRVNVGARIQHDMPGRDLTSRIRLVEGAASDLFVTCQNGGAARIWRVPMTGDAEPVEMPTAPGSSFVIGHSAALGALVYAATSWFAPPDLWSLALGDGGNVQLTHFNTPLAARFEGLSARPFDFSSEDGVTIEGWFVARSDADRPLPSILSVHAGPFLAVGDIFRFDFLLLAAAGYGVIAANFRGSAGYGEAFSQAIMGDWGRHAFADHIGGIEVAVERGWADGDRLGVWGTSHGGFAACWLATHCRRFRAAFAEAATTDFAMLYYLTDLPDVFARDLGGTPAEIPEIYRDRSPLTYAQHCATPTLLLHALDDRRCPAVGAMAFFRALHDAGCEAELLLIESGGHLSDSCGPLSARLAQNDALLAWFGKHL